MGLQRIAAFHLRSCGGGTDRGVWVSPLTHPTPPTTTKDRRRLHQAVGQWAVYSHMSLYRDAENVRPCAGKEGGVSVSCVLHFCSSPLPLLLPHFKFGVWSARGGGDCTCRRLFFHPFPLTTTRHDTTPRNTTRHRAHKLTHELTTAPITSEVRSNGSS